MSTRGLLPSRPVLVGNARRPQKGTVLQRFNQSWACNSGSGCHVWTGKLTRGYGALQGRRGGAIYAHRLSWVLHRGPIPEGLYVLHKCDNRPCVNPKHLFLGTYKDNYDDAKKKGRTRHAHGETQWRAKLSEREVLEIRASAERTMDLALTYGVGKRTIWVIRSKRGWKHLL